MLRHPPRHDLSLTLPATAPEGSVVQLSCASRLLETAVAQREDIHMAMGDDCVQYGRGRLQGKQQQLQRYQASSLSPHLQYHTEAGLWANQ